jgi:drug/metabolite transporter (DMT)-like permease
MSVVVPVLAALAGACVYGVTGVLQQRFAHRVEGPTENQAGLVKGLIANPKWVLSTLGSVVGFGLQGLALGTGPIALVQPMLVTGILFAAVTGFAVRRTRPDWPFMAALGLTAGGLAVFLAVARPTRGNTSLTVGEVLPLGIALVVLLAGSVVLGLRTSGLARSLSFALAAGLVYGVTAAVAKVTIAQFSSGFVAVVTHGSLWALVVLGPLGFLLNQNAFREGKLASPALAVITVTDPLVGLAIGLLWLNETIATGAAAITGEVAGLLAMVVGVWLVAHRAPQVAAQVSDDEPSEDDRSAGEPLREVVPGRDRAGAPDR